MSDACMFCGRDIEDGKEVKSEFDHYVDCLFCSEYCRDDQVIFDLDAIKSGTIALTDDDRDRLVIWLIDRFQKTADAAEDVIGGLLPEDADLNAEETWLTHPSQLHDRYKEFLRLVGKTPLPNGGEDDAGDDEPAAEAGE